MSKIILFPIISVLYFLLGLLFWILFVPAALIFKIIKIMRKYLVGNDTPLKSEFFGIEVISRTESKFLDIDFLLKK